MTQNSVDRNSQSGKNFLSDWVFPWYDGTMAPMEKLDALIDEALSRRSFPGIACGVWKDNHPAYIRFAGFADPEAEAPDRMPIRSETLFDAASLTKPLATSLLVLKAAEAGSIDLGDALGSYLSCGNASLAALSLRSLLTHSSGLPAIPALERHFPSSSSLDRERAIAALLATRPERTSGENVVYSCTGYLLLGLVLESVSGLALGELYRREIAEALDLPGASFAPGIGASGEPLAIDGAAPTEFCAWRGRRVRGQVHDESAYCLGGQAGNAGLFVSLEDVRITASLLLEEGWSGGREFLNGHSMEGLCASSTEGLGERRSLGFRLNEPGTFMGSLWPSSSLGHTGFTGTSLAISRDKRMMAIILTNRVYYGREETMQKMADFRLAFHSLAYDKFG